MDAAYYIFLKPLIAVKTFRNHQKYIFKDMISQQKRYFIFFVVKRLLNEGLELREAINV